MTITQEEADNLLNLDIREFEKYVQNIVKVPLQQHQFDALVSWTFNLGPYNLMNSTLLKELNSSNYSKVPSEIKRWNKSNNKVLDGLVKRREAEAKMFWNENWEQV
jgi:lysozyme